MGSRSLAWLFAVTLVIWTIHQFYSPAEGTTPAALAPRDRYAAAQALSNLALILAQFLGLVMLAPLLLRTAGPEALYGICAALFAGAAALAAVLPPLDVQPTHTERTAGGGPRLRSAGEALLSGWRATREDRVIFEAMADDVLVGVGLSALVVIVPFYLERVLGTAKENTVFSVGPGPHLPGPAGFRRPDTVVVRTYAAERLTCDPRDLERPIVWGGLIPPWSPLGHHHGRGRLRASRRPPPACPS